MATEILIRERKSVKHGKTYKYRFEAAAVSGKRKWISKGGFLSGKEAKAAGLVALNEYNNCGGVVFDSAMSYADFLDMWFEQECKATLKNTTLIAYQKRMKNHIKPALGKYELRSIRRADIQKFLNKMHDDGYSKNSVSEVKGILTKSFSYAVEEKYLAHSPAIGIKKPKGEFTKVPTRSAPHSYLAANKMDRILERFQEGHPSHIPLLLGYRCGLRIGEAFAILWDDIDFEAKTLSINKQVQWKQNERSREAKIQVNGRRAEEAGYWYFSNPKCNSFRTVDLDDGLLEVLLREKARQDAAESYFKERYAQYFVDEHRKINNVGDGVPIKFLCIRENGTYINLRTMQHASSVIQKQLEIPEFDYHSLRHTHTTMLIEHGAPIKYVQARMGHKNIDVTLNIYQHLTPTLAAQGNAVLQSMLP
jgi:integrase